MTENTENEYFTGFSLVITTIAIAITTFMEVLDSTIVNVSIPHIAGDLGATITQAAWTISFYALGSAIVVPLTNFITQRIGRIKVFIASIMLFAILSLLCGLSYNIHELIVFRFLQGFFSGPMVPLSQVLLLSIYPKEKSGLAMAFFGMTVIIAPVFGPILGGYITDTYSWPWLFYINVPVGVIASLLIYIMLRKKETASQKVPIDYIGVLLLFVGVGALQLILDNGNDKDWFNSTFIVALSIISFICIVILVIWELTDKNPAVDLSLFKNYNFTIGMICTFLGMFCFFGSTVIFPLWLQTVKGYTSFWSGLAASPVGILPFFLFPLVGIFLPKLPIRVLVSCSFLIFSLTMYWFSRFSPATSFDQMLLPRLIQGIGIAFFFLPLNQITLSQISSKHIVSATGLFNFCRTISTSFATAVVVFMWTRFSIKDHASLTEHITSVSIGTKNYLNKLYSSGINGTTSLIYINNIINRQAKTIAISHIFLTMSFLFLLLIIIVWFAKPPFNNNNSKGGH